MAVDTWTDQQDSIAERAAGAVRFALIAFFWMAFVAGPPIVGGVLGWITTRDARSAGPVAGLIGELPSTNASILVTREEVEAVGLDPRDVEAILPR